MFLPMKKLASRIMLMAALALGFVVTLSAQRAPGSVGVGAQFGKPTGLTVKVYNPNSMSLDILAAWDLEDFFFLNVHGIYEIHLGDSERAHFLIGPGAFAGIRDTDDIEGNGTDDFAAGISASAGLGFIFGIVEVYGQVTPRLELIEETDGTVGGGIGLRFYF